ncbi:hypothetical protein O6H91_08G116600 [Diphasiastrum complanatum]|uniref:Uncharacterized protein n=1 Tax=Diphasiastrum complanatum TaxID=34168 RepID=A0ACC2D1D4_DIPCM|nr:hypothetical protein O6H91_08G116600 [Diphasiastrum complanatum]
MTAAAKSFATVLIRGFSKASRKGIQAKGEQKSDLANRSHYARLGPLIEPEDSLRDRFHRYRTLFGLLLVANAMIGGYAIYGPKRKARTSDNISASSPQSPTE